MPGGVLCSEFPPPSEGSELVRKKPRLIDVDTLPGGDAEKPQLDTDISGTRKYSSLVLLHVIQFNRN